MRQALAEPNDVALPSGGEVLLETVDELEILADLLAPSVPGKRVLAFTVGDCYLVGAPFLPLLPPLTGRKGRSSLRTR